MAGNRAGGLRAAETVKAKFGENYFREIGRRGGKAGHTGGFCGNHELAVRAGRKGGKISRIGWKWDRATGTYVRKPE